MLTDYSGSQCSWAASLTPTLGKDEKGYRNARQDGTRQSPNRNVSFTFFADR